jgi:hypothetical protein
MLKGIDVSSYQTSSYSTSGLAFVGIKVTEGLSYVNPKWVAQRATARAAGLVQIFYHYPHVSNSASAEADYFLSQISLQPGDVLCLDWEWYGQTVTGAQARAYKDAWLARVKAKAPGHKVGVYSDTSSWKNVDTNSNCGDFLWIADYTTAGQPRIQDRWTFHQYTDQPTDLDVANFSTAADLKAWAGSAAPAPAPSPSPSPAPGPAAKPQWLLLLEHVMAVPEGVYEHWVTGTGWDNHTVWGVEYGEDGVPYCVIGAWDEYHECGLDSAVPKTDNVNDFTTWAQAHGEWTEWPSIGAWANFGNGSHCEIVIGFTATDVITKGWNSVQTGAADSGQGNGVWIHTNPRTDPRITGYLAPRFPDGICPPTASPHDPRGGAAQTEYIPEDLMPLNDADVLKVWAYTHGDTPDVHQTLATAAAQATAAAAGVKGLAAQVNGLTSLALTDAQIAALAAQLATSSGLVDAIAEKVAENIAARLAQ